MPEISPSRYMVNAGWDDVPHLGEKTKKELLESTLPHLQDARSKGTPSLGAGAVWPIPLSEILVDPFEIPVHLTSPEKPKVSPEIATPRILRELPCNCAKIGTIPQSQNQ